MLCRIHPRNRPVCAVMFWDYLLRCLVGEVCVLVVTLGGEFGVCWSLLVVQPCRYVTFEEAAACGIEY